MPPLRFLVTAGPTREAIDPVRFLSNRSSGKMGYAIAEAAAGRGHDVVLVSGPVCLAPPGNVETIYSVSAEQMYDVVSSAITDRDVAVMTAAVADYRPVTASERKIKKSQVLLTLDLEPTPDILGSARETMGFEGTLVGFAAETDDLRENAVGKLQRKQCDLLVANDVSRSDIGFESDRNEVVVFFEDGRELPLDIAEKRVLAERLVEIIEDAHTEKHG